MLASLILWVALANAGLSEDPAALINSALRLIDTDPVSARVLLRKGLAAEGDGVRAFNDAVDLCNGAFASDPKLALPSEAIFR